MNYEEIRDIAKDGDIIFLTVDKKNILSRLTSCVTKSPFTHVAFLFWYKTRLMIIESTTHGGIRIIQASTYYDREMFIVAAPKQWEEIADRALEKSGTATYGWLSAIYIGIREFLFTHFYISLPQDRNNRHKACSEFVSEILGFDDVDISPGMLYEKLNEIK